MISTNARKYEVSSTNKREKTITITVTYEDGSKTKYRSIQLPSDEWNYMKEYATENDIKNFLKSDDYYKL